MSTFIYLDVNCDLRFPNKEQIEAAGKHFKDKGFDDVEVTEDSDGPRVKLGFYVDSLSDLRHNEIASYVKEHGGTYSWYAAYIEERPVARDA